MSTYSYDATGSDPIAKWLSNGAGTEKLWLTSDGKLGIGVTSTPGDTLDVKATTATARVTSTTSTNRAYLCITNDGTLTVGKAGSAANSMLDYEGLAYAGVIEASSTNPLQLATNATARLTIDSSGKVGIGKNDPGSKLEIKGAGTTNATSSLNVTDSGGNSMLYVRDDGMVGIGNVTSPGSRLEIKGAGATSATSALNVKNSEGTSVLYVRNDGRIGINNDNPSNNLSITGSVGINGDLGLGNYPVSGLRLLIEKDDGVTSGEHQFARFDKASGTTCLQIGYRADGSSVTGGFLKAPSGKALSIGAGSQSQAIHINSSGHVGIQSTNPQSVLELGSGQFALPQGNSPSGPALGFVGDLNTGLNSPSADNLSLVTAGNDGLTIDSNGVVKVLRNKFVIYSANGGVSGEQGAMYIDTQQQTKRLMVHINGIWEVVQFV